LLSRCFFRASSYGFSNLKRKASASLTAFRKRHRKLALCVKTANQKEVQMKTAKLTTRAALTAPLLAFAAIALAGVLSLKPQIASAAKKNNLSVIEASRAAL
jgi:hypothetical protein